MSSKLKQGILVVNLGTPDSTKTSDVRKYLAEFLMDERVLDIPTIARALLVHGVILRTRPKKSAAAYRKVWMDEGSPLLVYGNQLVAKMRERLPKDVPVKLAMRYQSPSIGDAIDSLKKSGVEELLVFPLFPQYSSAATGSAIEKVFAELKRDWNMPSVKVVSDYFEHPGFIEPWKPKAEKVVTSFKPDHVLMSFHGLPKRHCEKSDRSTSGQVDHCFKKTDCCASIVEANRFCYRAQCYATARGIAKQLGLTADKYDVSFQSRLGRAEWIKPYTDEIIEDYPKRGIKKLLVICPAFTADCLETLEEIAMELRSDFIGMGGEDLMLLPSLNADDAWVEGVLHILDDRAGLVRT